jgi:hypothetical protein
LFDGMQCVGSVELNSVFGDISEMKPSRLS